MMTRDELRSCMKLKDMVDVRAKALEQEGSKLQGEKDGIAQASADLDTLRADLANQREAFTQRDNNVRANSQKLQAWNKELHQIASAPNSVPVDKRKKIEADFDALSKTNKDLIQERDGIYKKYNEGAKKFNIKAASLEKQINTWNAQNKKFNNESTALVKMRTDYAGGCTNRSFLEADRAAIKAGQ